MKIELSREELGTIIENIDNGKNQELMDKLCDVFNADEIEELKNNKTN